MITAINAIIEWLGHLFEYIYAFGKWILDGLMFLLALVVYMIFDALLTCVEKFFELLDLGVMTGSAACQWANLPPQMIYCLNQIGIPQALTMLIGAVMVRITINLIPAEFTRV